jgi:MerR family Zn(II)-responsive transcriptional regulator of zntA
VKIKALQVMCHALDELVSSCEDEAMPLENCPILAALENAVDESP